DSYQGVVAEPTNSGVNFAARRIGHGACGLYKVAQMKFMSHELTSDKIMQLGLGFWGSKTFLSAIELGVFTEHAKGPQDGESLRSRLDLHPRSARDLFDALVSLGMLERNNDQYANTPE